MKEMDPGKRIDSVWLFVAIDRDGDEGLPAFQGPGGIMIPMVASDERRRDILVKMAHEVVGLTMGSRIEVRKFTGDYVVEQVIE